MFRRFIISVTTFFLLFSFQAALSSNDERLSLFDEELNETIRVQHNNTPENTTPGSPYPSEDEKNNAKVTTEPLPKMVKKESSNV